MRSDMFYGVQFAQARYELELNARGKSDDNKLKITNSASQFIEEGADENHAIGHWTTISYQYEGTDIGDDVYLVIGKYTNEFSVHDHIWQLDKVCWEEDYKCGPWKVGADQNFANYLKDPKGWIPEMPEAVSLEDMEASPKTMEILQLRNGDVPFATRSALCHAKTILATSPVVKMSDSLQEAEVFVSVNVLTECEEDKVQSTRGSLSLRFEKEGGKWVVKEQNWYNYATLEPWNLIK